MLAPKLKKTFQWILGKIIERKPHEHSFKENHTNWTQCSSSTHLVPQNPVAHHKLSQHQLINQRQHLSTFFREPLFFNNTTIKQSVKSKFTTFFPPPPLAMWHQNTRFHTRRISHDSRNRSAHVVKRTEHLLLSFQRQATEKNTNKICRPIPCVPTDEGGHLWRARWGPFDAPTDNAEVSTVTDVF